MLCHLLGDYGAAKNHLEAALVLWREAEDLVGLAQVLDHLAWIAALCGELDRAEELSREALKLHHDQDDPRAIAVAFNNLGRAHFFRGALEPAEDDFRRSVDFRRRAGDDRGAAFGFINLALTRIYLVRAEGQGFLDGSHELDDAESWLAEAEELLPGLRDRPLEGWLQTIRSILDLDRGTAAESAAVIRQTLDTTRENQNQDGLAWAHLFLGEAEMRAGLPSARTSLETSLQSAIRINSRWIEVEARRRLAELAYEGRTDEAEQRYREALARAEECGAELTAIECRRALRTAPPAL